MKYLATLAAALATLAFLGPDAAHAFSYENQGSSEQPSAPAQGGKSGYMDLEPGKLIAPMGAPVEGSHMDFGPGAYNNGWAQQPTRSESVGPSWLYPPR